jgi:hypothetical protein
MSGWVKIPEEWWEREEIERLPADVVLFHQTALAYMARHSTDGRVPPSAVRKFWPVDDTESTIALLVTEGHWQPFSGGWFIRGWETFVLSAAEVEHRRAVSRQTSERYRRHKAGDHSMCDRCSQVRRGDDLSRDTSSDASVTTSVTPPPIRTDPTRRGGEGRGSAADSAGAPSARTLLTNHAFNPDPECCALPQENPVHAEDVA